MDPNRFDQVAKTFARRLTRRGILTGLGAGGIAAVALDPTNSPAADSVTCVYDVDATIDVGPSSTVAQTNVVAGELTFTVGPNGAIDTGALVHADGASWPVVGQAVGRAINLRFSVAHVGAFIAIGVGRHDIATCPSVISGPASGPVRKDAGSWSATLKTGAAGPTAPTAAIAQPVGASGSGTTAPAALTVTAVADGAPTGSGPSCQYDCAGGTPDPSTCACVCKTELTSCTFTSLDGQSSQAICADLNSSVGNCGACGNACPGATTDVEETVCINAACQTQCMQSQFVTCSPDAVCKTDLLGDSAHCGACDTPCPSVGQICSGGVCTDQCRDPYATCSPDAICKTHLTGDNAHCGSCGNACPSAAPTCVDSVCTCTLSCPGGTTLSANCTCDDCTADTTSDKNNCGACGNVCPVFAAACVDSQCVAPPSA